MKSKEVEMTLLFDFFGDLLTERQREFFDYYYNEDLSLGEIAENSGITRQGVRDIIVRARGTLKELEEKTGIVQLFLNMRAGILAVEEDAAEIESINRRQYDNERISPTDGTDQTDRPEFPGITKRRLPVHGIRGLDRKTERRLKRLRGKGRLSEADVKEAMREIRSRFWRRTSDSGCEEFHRAVTERAVAPKSWRV
jgi:predicted DNA-binding protein YlxM (UPF0122 family)